MSTAITGIHNHRISAIFNVITRKKSLQPSKAIHLGDVKL